MVLNPETLTLALIRDIKQLITGCSKTTVRHSRAISEFRADIGAMDIPPPP